MIVIQRFLKQVDQLNKRYPQIYADFENFKKGFDPESAMSLGSRLYKSRYKNSSILTGARGGFRIIVFVGDHAYVPIIIYSKTYIENISASELKSALKKVLEELSS